VDIVERLRFDAARCEASFSRGVASNIEDAMTTIERLRTALQSIADNTCCDKCQEAAQVARVALADIKMTQ